MGHNCFLRMALHYLLTVLFIVASLGCSYSVNEGGLITIVLGMIKL